MIDEYVAGLKRQYAEQLEDADPITREVARRGLEGLERTVRPARGGGKKASRRP